jgi:hypothetical protein
MSTVTFDVVRASTKYVVDENGDLSQVAANTPAFEYNADGTYKGMLVEEQRENICLQSEDFSTTWLSGVNTTVSAVTETTPDGDSTSKSVKIGDNNSTGTGSVAVRQDITVTGGATYTASIFLKADGLAFARLSIDEYDGVTNGTQYFGLSGSGSLGTAVNLDDSKIEAYPNGWYRCSVTWTQGAADTEFKFRIYVANSISSSTVDLDNTSSIFAWGVQVELGANASSYIPTTTTSVTRNKDQISKTSASTYVGQTAGTVYVEATIDNIIANTNIISVSDGTDDNIVRITFNANADMRMYVKGGTTSIINDVETIVAGTYKFAIVYSGSDTRVYRDGVQLSSSTTSLTFTSSVDEIDIGQSFADTGQSNNWIRAFAFYKRALTDTEAITLTS